TAAASASMAVCRTLQPGRKNIPRKKREPRTRQRFFPPSQTRKHFLSEEPGNRIVRYPIGALAPDRKSDDAQSTALTTHCKRDCPDRQPECGNARNKAQGGAPK